MQGKKFITSSLVFTLLLTSCLNFSIASANESGSIKKIEQYDVLDPVTTSTSAFQKVNDYIDKQPLLKLSPTLHVSPNAQKRDYTNYLMGMNRVASLWSEFATPERLNVVLFTELDADWVDQKQKELMGEWFREDSRQSDRIKEFGCNIAGMYLPGVLLFCVKEDKAEVNSIEEFARAHLFSHEYTHFVEMNIMNWVGIALGTAKGNRNSCWIEEGFATFYGFAVGSYQLQNSSDRRREFLKQLTFNYDFRRALPRGTLIGRILKGDPTTAIEIMEMLENTPFPCDETQNAYAFGSMAAEILVSINGHEGMIEFYKSAAETGNWRYSFEKAFDIPVAKFYEKAAAYFASQFTESNFEKLGNANQNSIPNPVLSPSPSPTINSTPELQIPTVSRGKVTIKCYKGKTIKKVTAKKPKCPKGYKEK